MAIKIKQPSSILRHPTVACRWGKYISDEFHVTSGTKQGGVLSPDLFSFYVDDLFPLLRASGLGCYIATIFVACFLFADDMALSAPTRSTLQKLINITMTFCSENGLSFNPSKTKVVVFGKHHKETQNFINLKIGYSDIDYVDIV